MKQAGRAVPIACVFSILSVTVCSAAQAEEEVEQSPTFRLQMANDVLAGSDNQFTNGVSLQKHSRVASSLADTTGTPAFGKRLARVFLPDRDGLYYREGWAIGQNMQTPEEIESEELILDDVPYVGMVGWANSFIAFDDRSLTGFQMLLGWIGEGSLAEPVQEAAHELLDFDDPEGWDNQLDNEPIVNFYFMKKRKLWRGPRFDGAVNFDAALGNFFTFAQVSLEMRLGRKPEGFAFIPTPIGRGMDYDATLRRRGQVFTYGSVTIRHTGFGLALPREGNNFTDDNAWTENNTVRMQDSVSQVILGYHHERANWGIHFDIWLSSETLAGGTVAEKEDLDNMFGVIAFERRF